MATLLSIDGKNAKTLMDMSPTCKPNSKQLLSQITFGEKKNYFILP